MDRRKFIEECITKGPLIAGGLALSKYSFAIESVETVLAQENTEPIKPKETQESFFKPRFEKSLLSLYERR